MTQSKTKTSKVKKTTARRGPSKRASANKPTENKIPSFSRIQAVTIQLAYLKQLDDDSLEYYLDYVTPAGKFKTERCSKSVYKDVNSEKLTSNFRVKFTFLKDSEDGLIKHIAIKTKPEFLPQGFTEEDSDMPNYSASENLELSVAPDSEVSVLKFPASASNTACNDVLASIQKDSNIKSGDYILGKYRISEIRERDGYKTVYIDMKIDT